MFEQDIPLKANRLLLIVLIIFVLIAIRVGMLTTIFHEKFLLLSKKPQYKTALQEATRGVITDNKGALFATNGVQYNAAIVYDEIRSIPKVKWKEGREKKEKLYPRREYIRDLAKFLALRLDLDPVFIEDLIYAKAVIFPNTPFLIKEGIDARTYYELKSSEAMWPGLKASSSASRLYPSGKVGCHLIGYMGAIDGVEHFKHLQKIKELETFLQEKEGGVAAPLPVGYPSIESVVHALKELQNKVYFIHSKIGKAGIEKEYDLSLRGEHGKIKYEIDTKGHIVRFLPDSKEARSGKNLTLNISLPLQAYAEELLAENEEMRDRRFRMAGKNHNLVHPPWIKGGAIIAMDPKSGQVLAFASYPRFDPSDFVYSGADKVKEHKARQINKWLETESYIAAIYDGKQPLEREYFNPKSKMYYTETAFLTWNLYLDMILSKESEVKKSLLSLSNMKQLIYVLKTCQQIRDLCDMAPLPAILGILYPSPLEYSSHIKTDALTLEYTKDKVAEHFSEILALKNFLDPYLEPIKHIDDKLLFLDLCHLLVGPKEVSFHLVGKLSKLSLCDYRLFCQLMAQIEEGIKPCIKKTFHERDFALWRRDHFKAYLKEKRALEKEKKTYERPYTDYLEAKEKEMLAEFYEEYKWDFLSAFLDLDGDARESLQAYTYACKGSSLSFEKANPKIEHLKTFLHSLEGEEALELIRAFRSYNELDTPLFGHYNLSKNKGQTHRELARAFYPISGFGYSRSFAYQEAAPQGSVFKIVTAYEAMKQHHKMHPHSKNPLTITDCSNPKLREKSSQILGYQADGSAIKRLYKGGRLPSSHRASGKIDLVSAFELSSNIYFSLLAIDKLKNPRDLLTCSRMMNFGKKTGIDLPAEISGLLPTDVIDNRTGLYAFAIGQHSLVVSPLQTAVMMSAIVGDGRIFKPKIAAKIKEEKRVYIPGKTPFTFEEYFHLMGVDAPLFVDAIQKESVCNTIEQKQAILREIEHPKEVRDTILHALYKVINGEKGIGNIGSIYGLSSSSLQERGDFLNVRKSMVGKTATAEILYRPCLNRDFNPIIAKHIWFSAASFKTMEGSGKIDFDQPEIVIIVYLRFGDFGKEAAPLAAKMIEKYRKL